MLNDIGILKESVRFYREPDAFTAAHLYYVPHAGIYHCNHAYQFERTEETCVDVCQTIIVDKGALEVHYNGYVQTAYSGMIVLLDCRKPHLYRTASDEVRFRWFHFAGGSSEAYVNAIIQSHGFVIQIAKNADIELCCSQIILDIKQQHPNPHTLSVRIHTLLALLSSLASECAKSDVEQAIIDSAHYIETHYADKEVSIPYLASHAALSTCYYLRKFKEYQSMTPHQFLQSARLRAAKEQLTTTSRSIEDIAETCGFCNTSHFVMTFRKNIGMTPLQFRIMWK